MRVRIGAAVLGALIVLAPALDAPAHRFVHPKTLRLGVKPDGVLVSVTYDVNPGDDARFLRRLFDRDASGALETPEQEKLRRYLEQTATMWLQVEIAEQKVALERVEIEAYRIDLPVEATDALGISIVYRAGGGQAPPERIQIRDRNADASVDVPVVVDLDPAATVVLSTHGELHPTVRQIQRVTLGPKEPLVLRVRWSGPRRDAPED